MTLLDSLIHGLSLTLLDADDADTSVFLSRSVPTVPQKVAWTYDASSDLLGTTGGSARCMSATPIPNIGCGCKALTLASNWALTNEYAPLWGHAPAWNATWSVGEIRKESCRRLCWSSMSLAAGHVSYMSACRAKAPELFISNPANVRGVIKSRFLANPNDVSMLCCSPENSWRVRQLLHSILPRIQYGLFMIDLIFCGTVVHVCAPI